MKDQESEAGSQAGAPLYDWWLATLQSLLGAASQPGHASDASNIPSNGADTGSVPQALKLAQQMLNSLGSAYFGALISRPANQPLEAFLHLLRARLGELGEQWAGMSRTLAGPAQVETAWHGLASGLADSAGELLKPVTGNLGLAYGGLADAFGLAPMRELESAGRELAVAALAQRRAQAQYLELALDAARQGVDALVARLVQMGERGETVDTLLALVRLCASTMDGAMHQAMQSPRALQVSAEAIRAGLRSKQQQQRVVALVSEALNVPTRAEVDEAYREIQQLKRELRQLRKGAPQRPPAPAATRARKPQAARGKASKALAA